jgi:hypothetical protein
VEVTTDETTSALLEEVCTDESDQHLWEEKKKQVSV